jgi:hypothetical protein
MKKLVLILCLVLFTIACEKDEGYSKDLLLGTWERITPQYESECFYYLIFSETDLIRSVNCPSDISSITSSYTFDGKKIVSDSGTWEIMELTSMRLKFRTSDSVREYKKP